MSKYRCVVGDTPGGGWRCALPTHSEDGDCALCQLTRRMVFELAKQLWISTVVSGGFANSSHRVLERVGKTYPCLTVRFANSLAGWCLSWQSNYGSALFVSGGFANSSHRVVGSWQNLPLADSALCQLTRRRMCELAKQLRISAVVSGGFANSSHRVAGRVGKTYAWFSVRFANSLGGWCVSWQSIHVTILPMQPLTPSPLARPLACHHPAIASCKPRSQARPG